MKCAALRQHHQERAGALVEGFEARQQKILGGIPKGDIGAGAQAAPAALVAAFDLLFAEASTAVGDLRTMMSFVQLSQPVVEDGNNFYVGMQEEIAKLAWESIKTLNGIVDLRTQYFEKRADMKDKIFDKVTTDSETKEWGSKGAETKGAEKTETEKSDTSTTKTKKTSSWEVSDERKAALKNLDLEWQHKCSDGLLTVACELARAVDLFEKNSEKILDPRGTGEGGNSGGRMYY